jgi:hypothetical protein
LTRHNAHRVDKHIGPARKPNRCSTTPYRKIRQP